MGEEGAVDLVDRNGRRVRPDQGGQSHHDARCAEPALAAAGRKQGIGPALAHIIGQAFESGDVTTLHPPDRRHTRHTRGAVHPDRAAPALTLRAAAVLYRTSTAPVTQYVQERGTVVGDLDIGAVDSKPDQGSELDQVADPVRRRSIS
jgi:hypothetical protein